MTWLLRAALTLGMISIALPAAASPIVGRIDTFEVGTTLGWFLPSPTNSNPPVNISTGGPGVAGDVFLEITAIGGGDAATGLSVLNESQGTGDYLAAAIAPSRMDENDFGSDDLYLRLLFAEFEAMGSVANAALTTTPMFVPPIGGG